MVTTDRNGSSKIPAKDFDNVFFPSLSGLMLAFRLFVFYIEHITIYHMFQWLVECLFKVKKDFGRIFHSCH